MFISKWKHIKNVYEPNGSRLPSVVVEKNHLSTKDVSKQWVAHPMLPPGILTRHSPHSQHQTHSATCYHPSYGSQAAIPSTSLRLFKQLHSLRFARSKLHQDGAVTWECSNMNIACAGQANASTWCQGRRGVGMTTVKTNVDGCSYARRYLMSTHRVWIHKLCKTTINIVQKAKGLVNNEWRFGSCPK